MSKQETDAAATNSGRVNEQPNIPKKSSAIEIDLFDILAMLLHNLWLIILVTALFAGAGYCYSRFMVSDYYQSTCRVYILDRSGGSDDTTTYNDLQVGTQLTKDYSVLIKSRSVLEAVIDNLGLSRSYSSLYNSVSVSNAAGTRIIAITVTDNSPTEAQKICDEIRIVASEKIKEVMAIDAANVIDEANLPVTKSGPLNTKNAVKFGAVGCALIILVLLIRYLLDDTIKTAEDVGRYLQLSVLTQIPRDEGLARMQANDRKKKRR